MVTLRRAEARDEALLLAWRNDPATRKSAFTPGEVAAADHGRWFQAKLADPACAIFIGERDGTPVGQVRLDRTGDDVAEVDVAVAPEARGQGVGRALLDAAAGEAATALGVRSLVAEVKPENEASLRAFRAAGFSERERDERAVVLTRALSEPPRAPSA